MRKMRCGLSIVVVLSLLFSFSGCTGTGASSVVPTTSQSTVNVAQNTSSPGPTKEYVMPSELVTALGRTPEEILQDMRESDVPNLYTDIWLNSQGTLTLVVTEEQRQNWLKNSEKLMNEYIDSALENGFTIQVSKQKDRITVYATRDISIISIMFDIGGVVSQVVTHHLFNDIPWKENGIIITFVNQDTGYILAQASMPTEAFEYTPEDWETSRTRDVVENPLPYEIEGYAVPGPSSVSGETFVNSDAA